MDSQISQAVINGFGFALRGLILVIVLKVAGKKLK